MDIIEKIKKQIQDNVIVLYMKGSPANPSCGFSSKAVQILTSCDAKFKHIDVLENSDIRTALPKYAQWPTFPQLWINGSLIGGCDIMIEMYKNQELQNLIKKINKKN